MPSARLLKASEAPDIAAQTVASNRKTRGCGIVKIDQTAIWPGSAQQCGKPMHPLTKFPL